MVCSGTAEVDQQAGTGSLRCLTAAEVAPLLGISKQAVYRAIRSGELPSIRIGRKPLVPERALRRLLDSASGPQTK